MNAELKIWKAKEGAAPPLVFYNTSFAIVLSVLADA